MSKKFIHALGIMSGTSIDAVDYSLIRVHKNTLKPEFLAHAQRALPKAMKTKILQAASNQMTTFDLSHLHFDLGRLYSKHVTALSKKWNWDVIGLHGQTVHHAGGKASLQLGTPSFLQISNPTPVISISGHWMWQTVVREHPSHLFSKKIGGLASTARRFS